MEQSFNLSELEPLREKARSKTSAVRAAGESPVTAAFDPRQVGQPSATQLQVLETMHKDCARKIGDALSGLLRLEVGVEFASVEQAQAGDFLSNLPEAAFLARLGIALGGTGLIQMDLSLVFPILDRILGGTGQGSEEARPLTEIEQELFEPVGSSISLALREGWEPLFKIEKEWGGIVAKSQAAALLPPGDKLTVIAFQLALNETKGQLLVAFPSAISAGILRKFAPQNPSPEPIVAKDSGRLRELLLDCRMDAELLLPRSTVSIRQLCGLQPGDVVLLKVRSSEPLPLHVSGQEMFLTAPVRCSSMRGAQIQKILSIIPKKEGDERQ